MPPLRIETWARNKTSHALVGFRTDIPENVILERPPGAEARLRAVERRAGRVLGEIDVTVYWPSLIVDRDGALCGTATAAANAMIEPPRSGYAHMPVEVLMPAGPAWRVDAVIERDENNGKPALPYATVLAIGHPDLRVSAALFVTMRSAAETWTAGLEMLETLRFAGRAAATAATGKSLLAGLTLAF